MYEEGVNSIVFCENYSCVRDSANFLVCSDALGLRVSPCPGSITSKFNMAILRMDSLSLAGSRLKCSGATLTFFP